MLWMVIFFKVRMQLPCHFMCLYKISILTTSDFPTRHLSLASLAARFPDSAAFTPPTLTRQFPENLSTFHPWPRAGVFCPFAHPACPGLPCVVCSPVNSTGPRIPSINRCFSTWLCRTWALSQLMTLQSGQKWIQWITFLHGLVDYIKDTWLAHGEICGCRLADTAAAAGLTRAWAGVHAAGSYVTNYRGVEVWILSPPVG